MDNTIEVIHDTTLFSSKELSFQIETYIKQLMAINSPLALHRLIRTDFVALCQHYIATASKEYAKISTYESEEEERCLLHFKLAEPFKDLLFLHRDVMLQLQIAQHKAGEFLVTNEAINSHFEVSKHLLIEALDTILSRFNFYYKDIYQNQKKSKKILRKYKYYKNPWQIYNEQFLELIAHINTINEANKVVVKAVTQFQKIKEYGMANCGSIIQNAEYLIHASQKINNHLKQVESIEQLNESIALTESLISKIRENAHEEDDYNEAIAHKIEPLQECVVPVSTKEGLLQTRKIDFKKTTQKWLDYELLQILVDLWANNGNMVSYFKHSLHNLNGSLVLAKTNKNLDVVASQLETFQNVHNNLLKNVEQQKILALEFNNRIEKEFYVTKIYSAKNFLDVSLQSSLSQITNSNSDYFAQLKSRGEKLLNEFSLKYGERLSSSPDKRLENSSKSIDYRMHKEENAHYDTLFLNKNSIGDLFIVNRTDEEKRIETTLKQWKAGFSKSILISGNALSGKTTFLEYISKKYFRKATIFLTPNTEVIAEGRKFKTTKNLTETLEQIRKEIYHSDPVIIIDNLELWQDNKTTFLSNIRALLQFIEKESDEALIIASLSKETQKQLDKRLAFSKGFSTLIDLSKTKAEDIYKALMLRHGASHKKIVDANNKPLEQKHIEQHILSLCKAFDYNVGQVLQAWTYSTTVTDNNTVIYNEKHLPFEDFFTDEETIILKHVILYLKINELQLKTFLGNKLEGNYKSGLKRLVNAKVLLRDDTGFLTINPVLHYDINRILKYRGVLK